MATPQLSPGVLVREVDLTVGRADNDLVQDEDATKKEALTVTATPSILNDPFLIIPSLTDEPIHTLVAWRRERGASA